MDTKLLKQKILDLAIRGKLVSQDPNDEPANILLEKIKKEKQELIKQGKIKKDKNESTIFVGDDKQHYEKFADGTIKNIEDEILLSIPKNWVFTKIRNIAFVTKLAGFEYTKNIFPNLCETGVPLFKGQNVKDGKIIYEFESFIPEDISNELMRSQINRKCLLTPYVGTIGNIGIHNKQGIYHLGSNVGKIEILNTANNSYLLEEFLLYFLRSSYGYKELTKYKKATAQDSISIEAIRNVILPLPPINEQQRIVEKIEELFAQVDKIEEEKQPLLKLIDKAKDKVLDLAMKGKLVKQDPDDEPASVLLEKMFEEKKKLAKEGKIKLSKDELLEPQISDDNDYYQDLPKSWTICNLKNITEYIKAGGDKPKKFSSTNEVYKIPVIANGEKNEGIIGFTDNAVITDTTITISGRGTVGYTLVRNYPFTPVVRLIVVKPYKYISCDYLTLCFRKFTEVGNGGAIPQLTIPMIVNKIIPLPPVLEQNKIVEINNLLTNKLNQIKDSL